MCIRDSLIIDESGKIVSKWNLSLPREKGRVFTGVKAGKHIRGILPSSQHWVIELKGCFLVVREEKGISRNVHRVIVYKIEEEGQ